MLSIWLVWTDGYSPCTLPLNRIVNCSAFEATAGLHLVSRFDSRRDTGQMKADVDAISFSILPYGPYGPYGPSSCHILSLWMAWLQGDLRPPSRSQTGQAPLIEIYRIRCGHRLHHSLHICDFDIFNGWWFWMCSVQKWWEHQQLKIWLRKLWSLGGCTWRDQNAVSSIGEIQAVKIQFEVPWTIPPSSCPPTSYWPCSVEIRKKQHPLAKKATRRPPDWSPSSIEALRINRACHRST